MLREAADFDFAKAEWSEWDERHARSSRGQRRVRRRRVNELRSMNGASGSPDIEGKVARVAMSERGSKRVSIMKSPRNAERFAADENIEASVGIRPGDR